MDLGKFYGFVVRHGETSLNEGGLARGITDVPLSSLGIAQAYQDANALKGLDVTTIRASRLERSKHHAKIIGKALDTIPIFTPRLDTIDIGSLTKQPEEKIAKEVAHLSVDEPNKKFPGGQSFNEWARQVWPEVHLFFVLIRYGRHPVDVTHGRLTNTINALVKGNCRYLDKETLRKPPIQKNGEIYAVLWDGNKFDYKLFFTPTVERTTPSKILT